MTFSDSPRPRLRCRPIAETDLDAVADLLARGFKARSKAAWRAGLAVMAAREVPAECPRFGFMLDSDGVPVGVLLTIYAATRVEGRPVLRCNLSSWYTEPAFQAFAPLLVQQATRGDHRVFFVISPAPHTIPTNEALGFELYSRGRFMALAAVARPFSGCRVERVVPGRAAPRGLTAEDAALLERHVSLGCIGLVAHAPEGPRPFVFLKTAVKRLPAARLLFARSLEDFVGVAGPLGRYLAWRGRMVVVVDGDTPVRGLYGLQRRDDAPKLCKGVPQPSRCDLADTEWVIFKP